MGPPDEIKAHIKEAKGALQRGEHEAALRAARVSQLPNTCHLIVISWEFISYQIDESESEYCKRSVGVMLDVWLYFDFGQAAVRLDPKNYNALVLEGAALQHLDKWSQSLEAFKKAVSISPNSLVAHQGIVSHYEKRGITQHEDLLNAYKQIANYYET